MASLIEDLQTTKVTLDEFFEVAKRVLIYLPSVESERRESNGYEIIVSRHSGAQKYTRPIRTKLFVSDPNEFMLGSERFNGVLACIAEHEPLPEDARNLVDRIAYTVQQSMGIGLDLLGESNSSRKHIGNRFEEFIRLVVSATGVANEKVVFKIPYPTADGEKMYSCETDMVLSSRPEVRSCQSNLDEDEIVVSLKTSSKDRMGKIFLDKMLMEKFADHPVKVVGIFHNDVQRKKDSGTAYTFVSGLFMVYTEFLCQLEGVYFLDPPPITEKEPYNRHIAPFSKFLLEDLGKMLSA